MIARYRRYVPRIFRQKRDGEIHGSDPRSRRRDQPESGELLRSTAEVASTPVRGVLASGCLHASWLGGGGFIFDGDAPRMENGIS